MVISKNRAAVLDALERSAQLHASKYFVVTFFCQPLLEFSVQRAALELDWLPSY